MSSSLQETCEQVRQGVALFVLDPLGVLCVSGEDRLSWLNGMVTNDVERGLAPGGRLEAAIVDVRGKLRAMVDLWRREDDVLLVTERERIAVLGESLGKMIVMEDVVLDDVSGDFTVLTVQGPGAAGVVDRARLKGCPADRTGSGGVDLVVSTAGLPEAQEALAAAGARAASLEALELLRIEAGIPRWGADVTEEMFPQEARIEDRRVSFQKGCYVGQEVVVRLQLRGHANRLLCRLDLGDAEPPTRGVPVRRNDTEVGQVTSSARGPISGRTVALALLRREASAPGTVLDVGEARASVVGPRT
ncbi:MAG: folate-binding protein YgfZ [Deltaproteobacteria bacterium]|nr:folate-binding protein YgfZ [Deltaproteobacteria bacterium]